MVISEKKKNSILPLSKQTIAIIGTSGFKGRSLLQILEKDRRIKKLIAIDRKKPPIDIKKAKFYKLDLTETLADVKLAEILKKEKMAFDAVCTKIANISLWETDSP